MPRHPLILDGSLTPLAGHQNCACTFYLVFKEPASAFRQTQCKFRRLGNLTSLPSNPSAVNNFFRCVVAFLKPVSTGFQPRQDLPKRTSLGCRARKKNCSIFLPEQIVRPARAGARSVRSLYDPAPTLSTSAHVSFTPRPASRRGPQPHGRCSVRRSFSNKNTRPRSAAATSCARDSARSRVA